MRGKIRCLAADIKKELTNDRIAKMFNLVTFFQDFRNNIICDNIWPTLLDLVWTIDYALNICPFRVFLALCCLIHGILATCVNPSQVAEVLGCNYPVGSPKLPYGT